MQYKNIQPRMVALPGSKDRAMNNIIKNPVLMEFAIYSLIG